MRAVFGITRGMGVGLGMAGCMASAVQAGLTVCNETGATLSLAVGYKAGGDWVSEGWWILDPDSCKTPIGGDLIARYYYYRATGGAGEFAHDHYFFCTAAEPFTIRGDTGCAARGYRREGFAEIDTGGGVSDHRITLVPDTPTPENQTWLSGMAADPVGEPFEQTALFQECESADGAAYCAFHADGWKWYAYRGGPTPGAFLDRLEELAVNTAVRIGGDMLSVGDISVEVALRRVTLLPRGDAQAQERAAMQGMWVSLDDPAYELEVTGSEIREFYGGVYQGQVYWRFADGCEDAPPGAGPAMIWTNPDDRAPLCYLPQAITPDRWDMIHAGRGTLLRFRRP